MSRPFPVLVERLLGLALALLLAGCVTPGEGDPSSPEAQGSPAGFPAEGIDVADPSEEVDVAVAPPAITSDPGVLVWVSGEEPPDLHADDPDNPSDLADWVQQGLVEGLYGVDGGNVHYPELLAAEAEVEVLNSGTTVIRYRLRDGLQWSDGTPLTAADVAYTHRIIVEGCEVENDRSIVDSSADGCEYNLASRFGYELVTDFDVESDTEFSITMAAFYAGWRNLYSRVFAEHAFGPTARDVDANLRRWASPDGILPSSGPLSFDRWEPQSALYLNRNDGYHGSVSPDAQNRDQAMVEGVQLVFVADRQTRVELLAEGRAHVVMEQPDPAFEPLAASDAFTAAASAGPVFEHIALNLLDPHLAKPEVRQAIVYAIDKEEIVERLYRPLFGESLPSAGLGNAFWMAGLDPYQDHQATYGGHDAAAAAEVLSAAGYTRRADGVWSHPSDGRLSLQAATTGGVALRDAQLDLVAEQLARAGIELVIDSPRGGLFFAEGPFSPTALAASASGGDEGNDDVWDVAQFSWTSGPWPGPMTGVFRSGASSNPYGFNNPAYDVAATECNATVDEGEQATCYNDLDRFVTTLDQGDDGLFVIPLTQKPHFYGFSATVAAGAVAPDVVEGGPLVNVVDFALSS